MKWSWKLGKFAGIEVYLHATFVLFVAWIALMHWMSGHGAAAIVYGTGFILALFGSVLLHEFGHALTARRYGIRTRNITLLPIGGIAQLERMPDKPSQELAVALAGPAVNAVIASALFVLLYAGGGIAPLRTAAMMQGSFLARVMLANVSLLFFNLLPAFPMDGGRALRALLKFRMEPLRATQVAATVGQFFALVFGFAGFLFNPMLVLIAIFIWFGASQEASAELMKASFSGVSVGEAMVRNFRTLKEDDSLSQASYLMRTGWQRDFPVMDNRQITGLLTPAGLMDGLSQHATDSPVSKSMQRDFQIVEASEPIDSVLTQFAQADAPAILVTESGRLAGLITRDSIAAFMMVRNATQKSADLERQNAA
jgi:Zn-dependent protease/predicted transcriptional regulator